MERNINEKFHLKRNGIKILLIISGILLYSIGLKWFVYPANILPAGFTGTSILSQKLISTYFGVQLPVTVYNVAWNFVPAIISFKVVGKRFTIISFLIMFSFSFIADYIPTISLTKDPVIAAIFGGILCGFGGSLFFRCGVSGGGTDFLAMSLSTKYHIQPFGYVMAFNITLLLIQGFVFGWDYAFYSIIYQYVSTQTINSSYRHYEARTIFIITTKPDEVSRALIKKSGHSSTKFNGIGSFSQKPKYMLYTVATQPEVRRVTQIIKSQDPEAFINIMKSNEVQGNFTYLSIEQDDIDLNY